MLNKETPARLRGIIPPLVTPLTEDQELDRPGLERLLQRVVDGGVHGLFILGTTGEGPALPYRVRAALVEATCEAIHGRLPVLVGISDTSLAESIDMAHVSAEAGADAVVYAPPSYFPLSQNELCNGVRQLAAESPLPVVLYNMPALTKTAYAIETIESLATEPNIIGVKDSSGDLAYFRRLLNARKLRPDWSVMVGPEGLLAETVAMGGDGGVAGGANVFPELFVSQFYAAKAGDRIEVEALQEKVDCLGSAYSLGTNGLTGVLQAIKAALAQLGVCQPWLCSPLTTLPENKHEPLAEILRRVGASELPTIATARQDA